MRSFDIFASTAWILYSFEISKTCKNGRFFTFGSTFLDGVAKIRKFSKKESNVNNLDICSYHFIVNWLIFAHAPSLQLCTTEFFCGFLGQCVNFKSVPDRQKLFKSPQIFCVSSTLCWLYDQFSILVISNRHEFLQCVQFKRHILKFVHYLWWEWNLLWHLYFT